MPLEAGTTIAQLDDRYPIASDPGSRGDDHLRLIKGVLKKQFPGKDGNGFAKPITVSEDFLNGLPQQLADMQADLDKRWPVGCALLLFSNQNPNGTYPGVWSMLTGDASLSLGDGSSNVGGVSGSNDVAVPLPAHAHGASFSGNQLPPHDHSTGLYGGNVTGPRQSSYEFQPRDTLLRTQAVSAGTPSGSVTIVSSGVANPTMNVRGARIPVNVWKRVS